MILMIDERLDIQTLQILYDGDKRNLPSVELKFKDSDEKDFVISINRVPKQKEFEDDDVVPSGYYNACLSGNLYDIKDYFNDMVFVYESVEQSKYHHIDVTNATLFKSCVVATPHTQYIPIYICESADEYNRNSADLIQYNRSANVVSGKIVIFDQPQPTPFNKPFRKAFGLFDKDGKCDILQIGTIGLSIDDSIRHQYYIIEKASKSSFCIISDRGESTPDNPIYNVYKSIYFDNLRIPYNTELFPVYPHEVGRLIEKKIAKTVL